MSGELGWHHPANPDREREEALRDIEAYERETERIQDGERATCVRHGSFYSGLAECPVCRALRDEDVNREQ